MKKQAMVDAPNSAQSALCETEFVVKPFVQTPDAEIRIGGRSPKATRWADRWTRRCGNPATSIIDGK